MHGQFQKRPYFGENIEIWPRYWPSKLKSRFLPPSFSRPTSISKWVGAPDYDISGPQLLDLPACEEISNSRTLTADQKYTMLFDNCVKLIKVEPINHVVTKFCFSHAKFYQLKRDDLTLGFSKEHLIKEILDPEYERLKSENELA